MRADDAEGYIAWRRAEERAAEARGHQAPAEAILAEGFSADLSTVWDWRRVTPSVTVLREWLTEKYSDVQGMAGYIASGALDDIRFSKPELSHQEAEARFRATIIPKLARDLATLRGERVTDGELARLIGASVRTVKRYRTD